MGNNNHIMYTDDKKLIMLIGDYDENDYPIIAFTKRHFIDAVSFFAFISLWLSLYIVVT